MIRGAATALAFALAVALSGRTAAAQGTGDREPPVVLGPIRCERVPAAALQWSVSVELGARLAAVPPAAGRWFRVTVECRGTDADIRVVDGGTGRSLHWHVDLEFEAPAEQTRTLALNIVEATHASRTELEAPLTGEPPPTTQPPAGSVRTVRMPEPPRVARPTATQLTRAASAPGASSRRYGLLTHAQLQPPRIVRGGPPTLVPAALLPAVEPPARPRSDDDSAPARAWTMEADAVFGVRTFTGGSGTLWSGGPRVTCMFTPGVGASVETSFEGGSVDAPLGTVMLSSSGGALSLLAKQSLGRVELRGRLGLRGGLATLAGHAALPGVTAAVVAGPWAGSFVGVEAGFTVWRRLRLGVAAECGYVLLPTVGTSAGQSLAGVEGPWIGGAAIAGASF